MTWTRPQRVMAPRGPEHHVRPPSDLRPSRAGRARASVNDRGRRFAAALARGEGPRGKAVADGPDCGVVVAVMQWTGDHLAASLLYPRPVRLSGSPSLVIPMASRADS